MIFWLKIEKTENNPLYHKYNDKLNCLWYSVDNKEREADLKAGPKKGKDMTTMNRFDYLNSERHSSAALYRYSEEWSLNFMRSSEIKQKTRIL